MNRVYKVIWSKVKHQYVVVSELAHSCTKNTGSRVGRSAAAVLAALVLTTGICAAPVQAEEVTDPYALLNAQVEETNNTSSDKIVKLVQVPQAKSVAPLANEEQQPGEGGSSTVTTPAGQHTIYNEEGFYAHNGQGTYNSLTKDGLFVGGTDDGEGLYVDNDGNIYTDGNVEIEGSFSAANGNATIAVDGTTNIRAGGSQLVINDKVAGITHGNASISVGNNSAEIRSANNLITADINGISLAERTGNTTVTINQDGMIVDGDFAVTGDTNLKNTEIDGNLNVSGNTNIEGGLTAGNLQTEGQLKAGSAVIDGSATVGGKLTAGDVDTNAVNAHNVSVDNELTAGKATVDGILTAGSADITNGATVGGALTAGSLSTAGQLTAGSAVINGSTEITGTATVGGLTTDGTVTANTVDVMNLEADKATIDGTLTAGSADIKGNTTIGGKLTAGAVETNTVDAHNVSVDNELTAGKATIDGTLTVGSADITNGATVGGTLTASDIQTAGTVTATNAGITNLAAGKADVAGTVTAGSAAIKGDATVGGAMTAGSLATTGQVTAGSAEINGNTTIIGNATVGSLTTEGKVTAANADITNLTAGKADINGTMTAESAEISGDTTITGNAIVGSLTTEGKVTAANADITNLTAGKADVEGTVRGGSFANTDNSFTVDDQGDVKAHNVTLTGTLGVAGETTLDSTLNVTGETTLTSALKVNGTATFAKGADMSSQKITNVGAGEISATSTDAVNGSQLDAVAKTVKTYQEGSGIAIADETTQTPTISVNKGDGLEFGGTDGNQLQVNANEKKGIAVSGDGVAINIIENGNLAFDDTTGALKLADDINVVGTLNVAGETTLTGALKANSTATFAQGASMGGKKITNVGVGEVSATSTDAVNGSQLQKVSDTVKNYQAGNGIAIANGDTQTPTISAKAADGGNIVVNANGISLAKEVSGLTSLSTDALTVNNNAAVSGTLNVNGATTLGNTLDVSGALTAGSVAVGGTTYVSSTGLNAGGKVISNVQDATEKNQAVNLGQMNTAISTEIDRLDTTPYKEGNGIEISEGNNPTISAKAADNGNIEVTADGIDLKDDISLTSVTTSQGVTVGGALQVTGAATLRSTLNVTGATTLGDLTTSGTATFNNGASMNNQKITGVATGVDGTDAVNVDQLNDAISKVDGEVYTEGNGIDIDEADNNKISVKVAADGNLEVNADGVSLKDAINLTSVTTGAALLNNDGLTIGTTSLTSTDLIVGGKTYISSTGINANGNAITNVAAGTNGTDAVNVNQLNDAISKIDGEVYTEGNGIDINEADNNKISVKAAADGNLEVDANGVSLKDNISVTSVRTSEGVTVGGALGVSGVTTLGSTLNVTGATTLTGALTANGAATFTKGASMNGQKITGVDTGVDGTDAVNVDQLNNTISQEINKIDTTPYTAGDGIDIDEADNNKISVKTGKGLTFEDGNIVAKAADGGNIVVDTDGISLAKEVSGLTSLSTDALTVNNNATVGGTLGVSGILTAQSVMAAGGFMIDMNNSLTSNGLTIGGTQYITSSGLYAGNKVITGVADGVSDNDAVNMSQLNDVKEVSDLAVTYRNADKQAVDLAANGGTGTTITNVANGTLSETSKDAVNGSQLNATNQIVGNGDYSSNNFLTDKTTSGGMNLTQAASALDQAIGNNHYTGQGVLETNTTGQNYSSITDTISALDLKIGNLTFSQQNVLKGEQSSVTDALNTLNEAVGSMDFNTGMNFIASGSDLTQATRTLDTTLSAIANAVGVRVTEEGGLSTTIDWTGSSISQGETVVGAIKNIDGRVTTLEGAANTLSNFSRSNISTLSALSNMDMSAVNALSSLSESDIAAISTLPEEGDVPAANADPTNRPGRGPGSDDSADGYNGNTTNDDSHDFDRDVNVDGKLDVTGEANFHSDATFDKDVSVGGNLDVQGETNMHGTLNMNDNKITGVKAGDISETSTDAVNGSQLWQTNQQVAANTENIGILGNAVNQLGDRIERVGAGAAALAALHPLDFDPDNKLDFAAGFGNYRGASAVAVGAFYRPSENVMFSIGGAFGGGEDMMNAGVSFKIGAGSGSTTTSRTAMAKSLKSMQQVVASQDAQLAQQREQIDKLTAMVETLMEKSGQAQPQPEKGQNQPEQ